MQFVPRLTDDPKVIAREQSAARHLPYSHHVDDRTIATDDGRLLQFVRLRDYSHLIPRTQYQGGQIVRPDWPSTLEV